MVWFTMNVTTVGYDLYWNQQLVAMVTCGLPRETWLSNCGFVYGYITNLLPLTVAYHS